MMLNCVQSMDYANLPFDFLVALAARDPLAAAEIMRRIESDPPTKSLKHGDHDQSDHGNWATGGGAGAGDTKDNPIRTSNVEEAARALGEGKHVELKTPDQVAVLLDRLNELAKEAEAAGTKAKNIDLCNLTVPGTNLFCVDSKGIPRVEMPQLKGIPTDGSAASDLTPDKRGEVDITEAYLESLRSSGVPMGDEEALASHLKATQNELNGAKVAGIMAAARAGELDLNQPIVVSRDGYIVDGHHRWAAKVALEYDGIDDPETDMKIPVVRVDQDILEILESSKQFAADMGLPQMAVKSLKHGDHDQSDHGSWAHGGGFDKITAAERKDFKKTVSAALNDLIEKNDKSEEGNKVVNWAVADSHGWSNEDVAVLRMYKGQGANDINESLREDSPKQGIYTIYEQAAMTETLDRMLASNGKLPQDMMVYRGMSFEDEKAAEDVLGQWKPGQVWTDPGFGSTSVQRNTAEAFANGFLAGGGETQVMWEINAPKGNSAFPMWNLFTHRTEQEGEILFPRDAHYRIDSVESESGDPDGFAKQIVTIKATMLADNSVKSIKHGDHDQSDHGSWAHGSADRPTLSNEDKNKAEAALLNLQGSWAGGNYQHAFGLTNLEVAAAQHYKAFGYFQVNNLMRGKESVTGLSFVPEIVRAAELLEDAMAKSSLQKDTTVYRGMHLPSEEAQKFLAAIKSGDVYTDPSFTSTSKSETVAMKFATERFPEERQENRTSIVWQIFAPSGSSALDFDKLFAESASQEKEILLAQDTHFKILGTQIDSYTSTGEPIIRVMAAVIPTGIQPVKHGDHDQSDHGNWADGSVPLAKTPIEQVDSLRQWSSNSYNMVNGALRNPDTLGAQERAGVREMYQKTQDGLDRLFAGVPKTTEEMTLYRGATGDWVKDIVTKYEASIEKGRVEYRETGVVPQLSLDRFTDLGFTSTSPDRDIAIRFSGTDINSGGVYTGEGRAIFEINIPEGSSIVNVEEFVNEFGGFAKFAAEEKEYLLPRGSTFEVADVTPSDEQFGSQGPLFYTIRLDLVPSSTKSMKHLSGEHDQSDHGNWATGSSSITTPTENQYKSLLSYTEGSGFINSRLRAGYDPYDISPRVKDLDDLIASQPLGKDTVVYRGGKWSLLHFDPNVSVGQQLTDEAFLSTTTDGGYARTFITQAFSPEPVTEGDKETNIMMEILLPKGFTALDIDATMESYGKQNYKSEHEVLLPRGAVLEITAVEERPLFPMDSSQTQTVTHITATVVPSNTTKSRKHGDHDQSDHGNWASANTEKSGPQAWLGINTLSDVPKYKIGSPSEASEPQVAARIAKNISQFKNAGGVVTRLPILPNAGVTGSYSYAETPEQEATSDWLFRQAESSRASEDEYELRAQDASSKEEQDRLLSIASGYGHMATALDRASGSGTFIATTGGERGTIVGVLAGSFNSGEWEGTMFGSSQSVAGTGSALMYAAIEAVADADKVSRLAITFPEPESLPFYRAFGLTPEFGTWESKPNPSGVILSRGSAVRIDQAVSGMTPASIVAQYGLTKSVKHGDHDQSDHGNWATGSEFKSPSSEDRSRTPKGSATSTPYAAHYYDTQQRQRLDMALDAYTHWKPENSGDTEADQPFHAVINDNLRNGMNRGRAVEAASAEFATGDEKDDEATASDLYEGFMSLDSATQNSRMMEDTVVTRASSPIIYLDELEAAAAGGSLELYGFDISQGAVFSDAGFVSTSLDTTGQSTQYFASRWDTEGLDDNQIPTSVRWNITVPEGAPALDLRALEFGSQHGEQEVILPRNTHFQVDSWDVQLPKFEGSPASVTINATVIPTHAKP